MNAPAARTILAAYHSQDTPQARPDTDPPKQKTPTPKAKPGTLPSKTEAESTQDKQDDEIAASTGYTGPSAATRLIAIVAVIALASSEDNGNGSEGVADGSDGSRELAESMSVVGRPGLIAPQPNGPGGRPGGRPPPTPVTQVVISRPGLQDGPGTGIGFQSRSNILTSQFSPLSGPRGRCNDLARAGFFRGSEPTCLRHFRPQRTFRRVTVQNSP